MKTIAYKIGERIKAAYTKSLDTRDAVCDPDKAFKELCIELEKFAKLHLKERFPNYGFWGEEGVQGAGQEDRIWVMDSIDGACAFTHHLPEFCFTLGLIDQKREEVVAGVIYNPLTNEMYAAEKGKGAYLNDRRLHVAAHSLANCWLKIKLNSPLEMTSLQWKRVSHLMPYAQSLRYRRSSVALDMAQVAAGKIDGFMSDKLKLWDIAAGSLLIEEAGGVVTTYENKSLPLKVVDSVDFLATSKTLSRPLREILKDGQTAQP